MKKATLLFFVLSLSLGAYAQKSVTIRMHYTENTTYTQQVNQKSTVTIKYNGSQEMQDKMKAQGVENPRVVSSNSDMQVVTKTGKKTDGIMPVTLTLSVGKDSPAASAIPPGTIIYGKVKETGMPVLDSIHSPGMEDMVKTTMLTTMQKTIEQLSLPAGEVKIGETLTQKTPINIPVGPMTMNMDGTTTYKLIKVENGMAYFDLQYIYDLKMNVSGQDMEGSGSGTGKMVYDLKNNFAVKNDSDISMTMDFEVKGIKMNILSNNVSSTVITISKQ